jgi:hypothetical protein
MGINICNWVNMKLIAITIIIGLLIIILLVVYLTVQVASEN